MIESQLEATQVISETAAAQPCGDNTSSEVVAALAWSPRDRWEARRALAMHRAETERLRVLADFLARPVHAPGGSEPDPDIVTAYNLAVEAALLGIRRASYSSS